MSLRDGEVLDRCPDGPEHSALTLPMGINQDFMGWNRLADRLARRQRDRGLAAGDALPLRFGKGLLRPKRRG